MRYSRYFYTSVDGKSWWSIDSNRTFKYDTQRNDFVDWFGQREDCLEELPNGVRSGPAYMNGVKDEHNTVVLIPEDHPFYNVILFSLLFVLLDTNKHKEA